MIWPAFILITSSLAIIGGVLALVFLFITKSETRSHETHADRAYRWREQMREKSHGRCT